MSKASKVFEAIKADEVDKVRALIEADPALVNAKDEAGNSAILLATYYGRKAIVAVLRAQGAQTSIFEAAAAGDFDRVRAWVEDDASLANAFSHDGYTPLGLASFFGHADVAEYLLAKGAEVDVTSQNRMKVTPLHSAAAGRHVGIVKALLEHGADVNAVQQDGFAPIHGAAQNGQEEMVLLLLSYGADIDARGANGQSALNIAEAEGHDVVAELLRRQGALA
jgi:ankyrin repeat protein